MHRITTDALPERLRPTTLAAAGITEADLQGWIVADPGIIDDGGSTDDDLLIITADCGGFGGQEARSLGDIILAVVKDVRVLSPIDYRATIARGHLSEIP